MTTTNKLASAALAGLLTVVVAHGNATAATKPAREKCYGVAAVGKNDCVSKDKSHSCAGQAKKDSDANEWVYVPAGLCAKLAGGIKG